MRSFSASFAAFAASFSFFFAASSFAFASFSAIFCAADLGGSHFFSFLATSLPLPVAGLGVASPSFGAVFATTFFVDGVVVSAFSKFAHGPASIVPAARRRQPPVEKIARRAWRWWDGGLGWRRERRGGGAAAVAARAGPEQLFVCETPAK